MSVLNALCPGTDPEVSSSLAYRDPWAAFPRESAGRWFDDRRACRDPGRNGEDYDEHTVMVIAPAEQTVNREFEFPERANAVRRVGPGSWQTDSSHTVDGLDTPEIVSTATYTLTRAGLTLTRGEGLRNGSGAGEMVVGGTAAALASVPLIAARY